MKKVAEFLLAWVRRCRGTIALTSAILLAFLTVHLLAGGGLREAGYGLLLSGAAMVFASAVSMAEFAARRRELREALLHLPEEEEALPAAFGPEGEAWRELASRLMTREKTAALEAERARRERTDYYTLWLHQIKTPLAALDLMAQSSAEVDRPLMRQELLKIEEYASSALNYQRLESIASDLHLTEVPLYPLCCQVIRKLRPLFRYGRIGVEIEPFDDQVLSDGKWLSVVLTQVVTNALKYTPAGGKISLRMASPGMLEISDTGIGIRPEDVPRVFDRGFTGQIGRSHEKSTGIGLYLCRRICDQLGHGITLSSEVGKGTTVRLDLRRNAFSDM